MYPESSGDEEQDEEEEEEGERGEGGEKWKQWYVMCVHAYISRVHTI